ncbi:helix-turn-helix domain-containing protein [Tessaracoccus lacteus]|uniref:Helix-turn-helix domain-containing protein n=1 Tax=Tessaracoccus lacteus TaxID=3041766 RepID=A0ABY8PZ13_9ACTN|nr:helix-turn-helix domain-containing protein [Tessaracoccus sp. T21]WGT47702.1 helix-turn-helix domain-containing protein [Tessaracoccus sp. T21]
MIEVMLLQGYNRSEIAAVVGVHRSTIGREIDRYSVEGRYLARSAQQAADRARARPKSRCLESNLLLRAQVIDCLNHRFSPRQSSEALRRRFPDDHTMRVSAETIYQALYVQGRGTLRDER